MKIRHITSQIQASLEHFPAVLLVGARQAGKSTVAELLVREGLLQSYYTLDDYSTLQAMQASPDDFLSTLTESVAIDEIQRVPDLMRALKKSIDQNRQEGRFLLTGSANILAYKQVGESLAGRMDVLHLEGLSAAELANLPKPSSFIKSILAVDNAIDLIKSWKKIKSQPVNKHQLLDLIYFGGFPDVALKANEEFSRRWFSSYLTAYIEKDVRDLSKLLDIVAYGKVLRLLALRTANQLNANNVAVESGLDQRTVMRYIELLEMTFQFNQLQAWHRNTKKRLVKTPKIYMNDSGLACFLAGIDSPAKLAESPFLGAMVETWVWSELRKALVFEPGVQASYYRTHQGHEVDFVLQKGDVCCGIEIKWSQTIGKSDFKGLKDFQDALGKQSLGIVLYTGNEIISFSESLLAVPVWYLLWSQNS